jgi:hypothetical protein
MGWDWNFAEAPMGPDYPAAHSQDTEWFAVDAAGHVAFFDSGENGHVPEGVEESSSLHELWTLRHPDQPEFAWWRLSREQLANEFGVYCYDYDDELLIDLAPYSLTGVPKTALHVDQLPPALRQQCKQIRFEKITFSESELVQPIEWFPCVCWYQESRVAYLASDGKTIRPIPGMEDRFAEFCERFHQENPEGAKKFVFEGPQAKPKKPRRRRRKESDDGQ